MEKEQLTCDNNSLTHPKDEIKQKTKRKPVLKKLIIGTKTQT